MLAEWPEEQGARREQEPGKPETVFEALVVPHRSLSRRGMLILSAGLALCSAGIAVRFWFLGAWPVIAFSGVEVALAILLLSINFRHARARDSSG